MSYSFLGYYDSPEQTEPAYDPPYDPPHDGPCLVCLEPLAPPVKTVNLMRQDRADGRSWFYRAHKTCYEADPASADQTALAMIDGVVQ